MEKRYKELCSELNDLFPVGLEEYYYDLIAFYKGYIEDVSSLESFLVTVFSCHKDKNNNIPRLMLNNAMRLSTLANDMEKIRPRKDALKIAYLVTCIETLYNLSGKGQRLKKIGIVIDFFENYLLEEDEELILKKVKRSCADYIPEQKFDRDISIEVFARIINETRNIFLHEGDYWNISLSHMNCPQLQIINVEEARGTGKQERTYDFELKYEELHCICVRAFINFIKQFLIEFSDNCV